MFVFKNRLKYSVNTKTTKNINFLLPHKMHKEKSLSTLTLTSLIVLIPFTAFASFKDVPQNHRQYEPIKNLEEKGIIKGFNNQYFKPEQLITRAELLKMTFNHIGFIPIPRSQLTKFKDVPPDAWFTPYVSKATTLKILDYNQENPLFYPSSPITRLEAVEIIMKLEGIPISYSEKVQKLYFTDVNSNAPYAYIVQAAQISGIFLPNSEKKFLPFKNITRAETAELLLYAQQYKEEIYEPGLNSSLLDNGFSESENKFISNSKFGILLDVWSKINEQYIYKDNLDHNKIVFGAINGMVSSLEDPYSVFDAPQEATKLQDTLEGSYEGIGTVIDKYENDFMILSTLSESPAEKSGLKAGDIIREINDESVKGLMTEELVDKIKGPADTTVKITVEREGKYIIFNIKRAKLTFDTVIRQQNQIDIPSDIGYIAINQFTSNTANEFDKALASVMKMEEKKKGLILDLRNNPGGYLTPTYDMLGHFIENGKPIVKLNINGESIIETSNGKGELNKLPLILLVNKNTASAAEVMAGALQDYKIGELIGEQTYGKGTVQEITTYADDSMLKLSIAQWFTPSNQDINEKGLTPDIIIKTTKEDLIGKSDGQLQKAIDEIQRLIIEK